MSFISMEEAGYWGKIPDRHWAEAARAASERSEIRLSMYCMGDPDNPDSPLAVMVKYPPNYDFPRHSHPSGRMEVIVKGSILAGDRELGPGSVMTAEKNQMYGPHLVGPEGALTVEIMSAEGGYRATFSTPQGDQLVDLTDPEFMKSLETAYPI